MAGSQISRGASLLRQFSHFATGSASSSGGTAAAASGSVGPWLLKTSILADFVSPGATRLGSLFHAASRRSSTPLLLQTPAAARGAASQASVGGGTGAASRLALLALGGGSSAAAPAGAALPRGAVQGMLLARGVLSRGAATGAAQAYTTGPTAGLSDGAASIFRRCAGLMAGLRGGRPAALSPSLAPRLKSTAAAAAQVSGPAVATAAAGGAAGVVRGRLYGGAALSEGLSTTARMWLAAWLAFCSVWVYSMVVLGGTTRLTRSGLSMTEWKLAGERPPMTEPEWVAEFTKYQASPEFQKVHRSMSLDEFKFIYWMEYAHRMWGRFLGLAFALPAAAFVARGWVTGPLARRLGLLFFMGGTQGLVGWWMVRSGLEEPEHEWAAPRVSPYRLAAHLVSAFAIYATLVWTSLDLLYPRPATASAAEALVRSTALARRRLLPLAALITITATSGAFVAGMDAGRAYNTFPLMGGQVVPHEYVDERLPPLRNLFENTAAVQFNHRLLASATLLAVGASWLRYRGGQLPGRATTCLHVVAGVTALQFALGIQTLLQYVPVHLGVAHQANALNLFTAVLALLHACRPPATAASGLAAVAAPLVTPAAVLVVGCIGYGVAAQNGTLTQSSQYTGPSTVTRE